MNLHGSAQEALQQGVMQFLSNQVSLGKTLGKTRIDAGSDVAYPEPVQQPQQHHAACDRHEKEPPGLKPGWRQRKTQPRSCFIPNIVVIAGYYLKRVRPGTKLGIKGLTSCARVLPALVDALEFVAESHALRNRK